MHACYLFALVPWLQSNGHKFVAIHATADNATRRECALADLALVDAEWRARNGGAS